MLLSEEVFYHFYDCTCYEVCRCEKCDTPYIECISYGGVCDGIQCEYHEDYERGSCDCFLGFGVHCFSPFGDCGVLMLLF